MYTVFDFDKFWDLFTQSPDPELFDPVAALLYSEKQIETLADESDWLLFP